MENNVFDRLRSGVWMYAGARDFPEASEALLKCADKCHELNNMRPSDTEKRSRILREILGSVDGDCVINGPFRCDFGFNIHIGKNFVGNFNLTILDEAEVIIGDNVLIGPNCTLITITHALDPTQRSEGIMCAKPILIGDNVWIASNVTILPGVTIGNNSVIGAGSVVTRSIDTDTLAVGNPCRPLRKLTDQDRVKIM